MKKGKRKGKRRQVRVPACSSCKCPPMAHEELVDGECRGCRGDAPQPLPERAHDSVRYAPDYQDRELAGAPVVRSPDGRIGVWLHPSELWLIAEGLYEREWETGEEEERALALHDHLERIALEVDPLPEEAR